MTHDLLDETIIIIFAELARFSKTLEECTSDLDRMLYVLKNSGNLKKQSSWLQNKIYAQILKACEIAKFSEEKRIQYNKDMKDERRLEGELQAAKRIGWEEGREEAKLDIASKLKKQGVDIAAIMLATGLSIDEVENL
jgi:predicted transposase/invertase (TIGR01784 family)